MKTGMLKVTTVEGSLWLQCEKVTYVKDYYSRDKDGVSSVVAFVSGDEVKCLEAASWIRNQLCPPHH
mgnify:FL=1|tara:strand:- start:87 stop:287 length:201 start_codon:yes stop_codon:yes gene_type:complete